VVGNAYPKPAMSEGSTVALFKEIKKNSDGLVPVIVQDDESGEVLMLAYMNEEALEKTIQLGKTYFYSRSRNKLWCKGESSGHTQEVLKIYIDCDHDTLLVRVKQNVAACHTGYYSCFYRQFDAKQSTWKSTGEKVFDPEKVYE